MSGRVQGISTSTSSESVVDGFADRDIRLSREQISSRDKECPIAALMYEEEAVEARGAMGGDNAVVPSG